MPNKNVTVDIIAVNATVYEHIFAFSVTAK